MDQPWLETSGAALRLAQDFGRLGLFERNVRTRVGRWDPQMYRLFGFDPEEPIPDWQALAECIHLDDRPRVEAEYAAAIRTAGRYASRFRLALANGDRREVQALLEVHNGADGQPESLLGIIIDDTEGAARARAQEELNAKLADALRLAQIAVWHIDLATNRLHHNDASEHLAGMPAWPQYVDLDVVRAATHPDDLPVAVRAADEALARPGAVDAETRYLDASGRYRDVLTRRVAERDSSGKVIGLMGVSLDQTERVAERKRAQDFMRRMDLVADAAGVGIWSVDVESGEVEWNAQMFRIYGRDLDEPTPSLRQWIGHWIHPDDRRPLAEQRRGSIESDESGFETEFRIVRPDGTVRRVACRSRREVREGRSFHVGIHLDVTDLAEQRASAEQARRDKLIAERASQAKSEFMARMSHELRTPLNAVLGFAQLIEHDGHHSLAPAQLDRVAHIRLAGEHLLSLIGDVLDLSATEAGTLPVTLEPVDIDALLGDVMHWVAGPAQRARVSLHLERSGGRVLADPRRLRQVLSNLLSNAVKYNRAGGEVWLSSRRANHDGQPSWALSVRDNGR
ncbi:MAG TPA: PAS domain-containing protein, partial [Burkholderiaceae bacterium]|nr:PAS domain-containing protein [Burkholderiaceae bacterium]